MSNNRLYRQTVQLIIFYLYLIFHVYVARFNVTVNFWNFERIQTGPFLSMHHAMHARSVYSMVLLVDLVACSLYARDRVDVQNCKRDSLPVHVHCLWILCRLCDEPSVCIGSSTLSGFWMSKILNLFYLTTWF